MERVLSDKIVTARKPYPCDASEQWRKSGYIVADCDTDAQRRAIADAEADKWQILPGQAYRRVTWIDGDEFCTYRARLGMDALCRDLDLWDE